jgi:RNA polymerase sigma factor (sigma-70 family)
MVWGVCRRVLHNHHDAEDAFQATFLVLVRRAASIEPREMVASWLHGVARRTALKARATAAKRMGREKQMTMMPEPAVAQQDTWHDLRPLLDQELGRLPERYRAVLVLCDLEGNTRKEAARQLGVPEGTIAGWLTRARIILARRIGRRGVAVCAGGLATVISRKAASAPVSLLISTIKAARLFAAGPAAAAGAISLPVVALTEGVLKSMVLNKAKMTLCAALVIGLLVGGGWGAYSSQAGEREAVPVTEANQPAPGEPEKQNKESKIKLPVTPAPVQVLASIDKDQKLVIKTNVQSPGEGKVAFGRVQVGGAIPAGSQVQVKMLHPVIIGEMRTQTYDLDKVEVTDTLGKKLDPKELMRRLKKETLALASLNGEAVDPQHLRLIKEGTMIFVLPAPKDDAGGPQGVPGVPGIPAIPPGGLTVPGLKGL